MLPQYPWCVSLKLPSSHSLEILTNLHGAEMYLECSFFYSSLKSTAGEPRFQQAVAEIYEVTLDFDNVCIMDECAKRAHECESLKKADSCVTGTESV